MVDYANQHQNNHNNYYQQYGNYYIGNPMPVSYIETGYPVNYQQQQQYFYP